jgi:hypothetical protein
VPGKLNHVFNLGLYFATIPKQFWKIVISKFRASTQIFSNVENSSRLRKMRIPKGLECVSYSFICLLFSLVAHTNIVQNPGAESGLTGWTSTDNKQVGHHISNLIVQAVGASTLCVNLAVPL